VKKRLIASCLGFSLAIGAHLNGAWFFIPLLNAQQKPAAHEFENRYLKIQVLPAWTPQPYNDPTLDLVRGKYVLSINPIFTHASGIEGGRFNEFANGKPSIDSVMANVEQPAGGFECAQKPADEIAVRPDLSLQNLYTDRSKTGNGCVFPANGSSVWFGSYFSGGGSESDYSITLTYSSDEVNDLPAKDSAELKQVFAEVREMLQSLQLKSPVVISKIDPPSASPGETVTIYGSGFRLFQEGVELRFKQFPNNSMPEPTIAADGSSLTFQVPFSIDTVSCPAGRIDVDEMCVPTPANHVDIDDCPPRPGKTGIFCGKPIPQGAYELWASAGEVNSNSVQLTVLPAKDTAVAIILLYPNLFVSPGDLITIRGRGFTPSGNTVKIGAAVVSDLSSSDGKTLTFPAPAPAGVSLIPSIKIYSATVANTAGQSNSISFGYR
jgi:hypothetical protein